MEPYRSRNQQPQCQSNAGQVIHTHLLLRFTYCTLTVHIENELDPVQFKEISNKWKTLERFALEIFTLMKL